MGITIFSRLESMVNNRNYLSSYPLHTYNFQVELG